MDAAAQWSEGLARIATAEHDAARAQECLHRMQAQVARLIVTGRIQTPHRTGLALAQRRAELRDRELKLALHAFTGGRPIVEVLWSAADEL
jgi:hypothetical protein